jgi:hypothetical protein
MTIFKVNILKKFKFFHYQQKNLIKISRFKILKFTPVNPIRIYNIKKIRKPR